jgi:hypothetical protein
MSNFFRDMFTPKREPQRDTALPRIIGGASLLGAGLLTALSDASAADKAALFVTPFIPEAGAAYGAMKGAEEWDELAAHEARRADR